MFILPVMANTICTSFQVQDIQLDSQDFVTIAEVKVFFMFLKYLKGCLVASFFVVKLHAFLQISSHGSKEQEEVKYCLTFRQLTRLQ